MAEGTVKPKKAKGSKKAAQPLPPPPPPAEEIFGWATWATLGAVLVGGVVAWKLIGTSYKRDVGIICNVEKISGFNVEKETSKATAYLRDHLGTPEGNELYSTLADAHGTDRPQKLQAAADSQQVSPCPLVDAYREMAAQGEYRVELQRLCSDVVFPKLLASDDPARLDMLEDWIDKTAKSPRTKALGDALRQAQPGHDRAEVLHDAATKAEVLSCTNAKSLENPPPAKPTGAPIVRLFDEPDIIGGLRADDVKRAVADAQPALLDCYNKGMDRKPDLTGRVAIRLQIDSSGNVIKDNPGEDTAIADKDTLLCIAKVARGMKFSGVVGPMASVMLPLELTHQQK
jgi:hypothetical protein